MTKINFITSWNTECGIADTTRLLVNELEKYEDIEITICPIKKSGPKNPFYFFKLLKNIEKNQITHIQYHSDLFSPFISNFSLSYFPIVIFFLKFWRKNIIITTVHEIDSNSMIDKLIIKFLNLSDKLIAHNCNLIYSMEEKGVKKDKLFLIPLGTSESKILDKKLCKKKLGVLNKKILTIFGFIGLNKGHDLVIDILPELNKDCILIIAGEPRTKEQIEYKHLLEDKISSAELENRVKFLGFVDENQLSTIANATDVFLYPYRWIVASAALNMALSYQIPTITSNLDYFKGLKRDYDCIELFKSENKQDLLEKIQELLSNSKQQNYLKEKCRFFNKKTSWKSVGDKTRELYLELI
ncbi:glycosyltransferase [Methanobacterium sp.]|uniref:glycosyltransferase n=1 Tax=Methanobacterium sp. TaxID=2164 RepID=UPI003C72BEA0